MKRQEGTPAGCRPSEDYPLCEVPADARRGFWSNAVVLLGFTFFTATMFGGGRIGTHFRLWPDLLLVIVAGNLLLGIYVAALSLVASRTGLNTLLMSRFSFGDWGSKWPDFLLGFTQIGWYAWGTATIAKLFVELLEKEALLVASGWELPLMVVFGFAFCWTAYIGYRGLEALSKIAVPMMILLIFWSLWRATADAGGLAGLAALRPRDAMTWGGALTIVFGTFVSGGTQATNWTRFANSSRTAVVTSLLAFFIGNGLMIVCGAYGALVYQEPDIVKVLARQGLLFWGIIMLFLNIWTTQDNTIYNFSVAGCNLLRTGRRRVVTLVGAAIGTALALAGMYDWLVPYLVFLGTFIPPLGGVILADYWLVHRGQYPLLAGCRFKRFNWAGLAAYAAAAATAAGSGFVPPITGIVLAFVLYPLFIGAADRLGCSQGHEPVQPPS